MRPLYIAGTQRDVGKTMLSIGLLNSFKQRGLRVGYTKPLGQRVKGDRENPLHEDAMLVSKFLNLADHNQIGMVVPLPRGRVEKEILDESTKVLAENVCEACKTLAKENDIVIIESMGHVAMGSCLGLSSAEVARTAGARILLVSGGGIGQAIDSIALCSDFLAHRGADLMGVVINKVWPEKYSRIKKATTKGLENLHLRTYGTIPYEKQLSCPNMQQVFDLLGGELIGGQENLGNRVQHAIVAAMEASHMVCYVKEATLVITPGDRGDNIMAALSTHLLGDPEKPPMAGLVLTGGFRPEDAVIKLIHDSHLPTILVKEDTYTAASKYHKTVFKMTPEDDSKVEEVFSMVDEYVDTDRILRDLDT